MTDSEEKTRVTAVVNPPGSAGLAAKKNDCLVVIYTKEPTLLGKRFVLEHSPTRIGRGADNHIVLDGENFVGGTFERVASQLPVAGRLDQFSGQSDTIGDLLDGPSHNQIRRQLMSDRIERRLLAKPCD